MKDGRIAFDGEATMAIGRYLKTGRDDHRALPPPERRPGNGNARFTEVSCTPLLNFGDPLHIRLRIKVFARVERPDVRVSILDANSTIVTNFGVNYFPEPLPTLTKDLTLEIEVPSLPLAAGNYNLNAAITEDNHRGTVDRVEIGSGFQVAGGDPYGSGRMPTRGALIIRHAWRLDDTPFRELTL
jgi:hypothetical protein